MVLQIWYIYLLIYHTVDGSEIQLTSWGWNRQGFILVRWCKISSINSTNPLNVGKHTIHWSYGGTCGFLKNSHVSMFMFFGEKDKTWKIEVPSVAPWEIQYLPFYTASPLFHWIKTSKVTLALDKKGTCKTFFGRGSSLFSGTPSIRLGFVSRQKLTWLPASVKLIKSQRHCTATCDHN